MKTCFVCDVPYDKGIGICCSRQCHNIRINSQRDYSATKQKREMLNRIEEYDLNPSKCFQCQTTLSYHNHLQKYRFCSRSCGAVYTNTHRDPSCYRKIGDTLRAKADLVNKAKWPSSPVAFGKCKGCQKVYRKTTGKTYCTELCKVSAGIKVYRRACKFRISKKEYSHLFNKELLAKHGWYRASNHPQGYNPDGATWDHLFRVEDGFDQGIDPSIMCHPANAEMISWKDNFARKTSTITYEELLERIKNWP